MSRNQIKFGPDQGKKAYSVWNAEGSFVARLAASNIKEAKNPCLGKVLLGSGGTGQ